MCCWCVCTFFGLPAQELQVLDCRSLQPLEGVRVAHLSGEETQLTDGQGLVQAGDWAPGDSLQFQVMGFGTEVRSFAQLVAAGYRVCLTAEGIDLQAIVVGAPRNTTAEGGSPPFLLTLDQESVRLRQPATAAELLGGSGEVFVQKSQLGGGSPMLRGFAANRVLLSVDGIRLNSAIFRSGNVHQILSLDPLALERVEVAFGPSTSRCGPDAIGGAVHFHTRNPQLSTSGQPTLSGQALFRFASASQEKTGHLDLAYARGRWALLSSFTHQAQEDLRMGRHGPADYLRNSYATRIDYRDTVVLNPDPLIQVGSGFSQRHLMQKVRYAPHNRTTWQYGLHYATTSDIPRYDRLQRPRGESLRSAEWHYGPQRWMMHHLQIDHRPALAWMDQWTLRIAVQRQEESRTDRDLGSPWRRINREQVRAGTLHFDATVALPKAQRMDYGWDFTGNLVHSLGRLEDIRSGQTQAAPTRYPDGARWYIGGFYTRYQRDWQARHQLQLAARYTFTGMEARFDQQFYAFPFDRARLHQGALTGHLGGRHTLGRAWQWRWQLGTAFRSPNVDDLGKVFDSTPGAVVVPNPGLRPEYAWQAETGLIHQWGAFLQTDLTAYTILLDQAMVRRPYRLNGQDSLWYGGEWSAIQAIQNAASARVSGLQARARTQLAPGLQLTLLLQWQEGTETLEDGSRAPLRHAAPAFGALRLQGQYRAWQGELQWDISGAVPAGQLPPDEQGKEYLYARKNQGAPYSPAWSALHFRGSWQSKRGPRCHVGIENILDRRYRPYSSGISAPGRNIIIALALPIR